MKALVTGAAGFIGRAVVQELLQHLPPHDITAVVRTADKGRALELSGVRLIVADLRDAGALAARIDPDTVVFHLAARVKFGLHGKEVIDFDSDNVTGTERLLAACPDGLRRFVHMSSVNAVERTREDRCESPITEASPCRPQTPYGRSKLMAEQAVRRIATARQIPFEILRPPSIVYGAGCDRQSGMAQLIQRVSNRSLLTSLDLPGRFSLIHVTDLAEATVRIGLSTDWANETFFLADEPPRTLRDVCGAIAGALGIGLTRSALANVVGLLATTTLSAALAVPPLARRIPFQVLMLIRDQAAVSSAKARTMTGFTTRISLEEGLRDTIPWVLNQRLM